jgi:hypothetical protein
VGYWGTVVVARPQGLLIDQLGVAGFGHQYHWLRELGHGWQMLEVTGFNDPPDLRGPCEAVVASTGHPVLAAYISDSYCAAMCTAAPGRVGPLTHLWPLERACGVFAHQPRNMADPVARSIDEFVEELIGWSAAAGLRADVTRLRAIVSLDEDEVHSGGQADDLVFALVKALGVRQIGRTLPRSFPASDWPFSAFMSSYGPHFKARQYAEDRADGALPPAQPWESSALALEAELWASLYRPEVDAVALARRAAYLYAEYRAAPRPWGTADAASAATEPPALDQRQAELLARLEAELASGVMSPRSDEFQARRYADARATDPTTRA